MMIRLVAVSSGEDVNSYNLRCALDVFANMPDDMAVVKIQKFIEQHGQAVTGEQGFDENGWCYTKQPGDGEAKYFTEGRQYAGNPALRSDKGQDVDTTLYIVRLLFSLLSSRWAAHTRRRCVADSAELEGGRGRDGQPAG